MRGLLTTRNVTCTAQPCERRGFHHTSFTDKILLFIGVAPCKTLYGLALMFRMGIMLNGMWISGREIVQGKAFGLGSLIGALDLGFDLNMVQSMYT